jgi:cytochrome c
MFLSPQQRQGFFWQLQHRLAMQLRVQKYLRNAKPAITLIREKNKSGPHLVNIVGRAAGAVDGFKYSKAMAGSGLVWDEATLAGFLAKPKKYLKGTKMSFAGLKKESDIANVIAYLKSPK